MRARTHEQQERKNQLLFYYSKEDITEMLIDAETIIDALNYKIKILEEEKKEQRERIDKAIEYIHSKEYQYGDLEQDVYDYNICFDEVEDLLKILKGED